MIIHSENMVTPFGINGTYCYVRHKKKKQCKGCRQKDETKLVSCQKCKIKAGINNKYVVFCYECVDFPCVLVKRLDKSYQTRYDESLKKKLEFIKEQGLEAFLNSEKSDLNVETVKDTLTYRIRFVFSVGNNIDENVRPQAFR